MRRRTSSLRVLAVAPSTTGFGYAILEEPFKLVDWGAKRVTGARASQSIAKVRELAELYLPNLIALPAIDTTSARRLTRAQQLVQDITKLSRVINLDLEFSSQADVKEYFFAGCPATKHDLATILAAHFPDELGTRVPPKRRPWMSEDYRMDIFAAVGLAVTTRWKKTGTKLRATGRNGEE